MDKKSESDWGDKHLQKSQKSQESQNSLITNPAFYNDKMFYRHISWILGGIAILCIGGAIGLSYFDKEIPDLLTVLGTASITALISLFTIPRK